MEVDHLTFSYEKRQKKKILDDISFKIPEGKITTFLGANGCGKSTLFQLMTKNLQPDQGMVCLNGVNISEMNQKSFARKVSVVHQYNQTAPDITVEKLVSYGRTPHLSMFGGLTKADHEQIEWAMDVTDTAKYRDKETAKLSGGQKQRVFIAMALAQQTNILFLDEPTTYLDIRYQIELLEMIQRLNEEFHITIVMMLHDMNHAVYYSDEIVGLKDGKVMVQGAANEVVTSACIEKIYGIRLKTGSLDNKKIIMTVR